MAIFHVDAIPVIFACASKTATSIGITASVFGELGYLRTREGQIVIGAAVLDDILGIVVAPAKMAGIASTWKIAINPRVPRAKGSTTPTTATLKAWPPTAISSSSSLSIPVRKSRE